MRRSKARSEQHLINEKGERLLREVVPAHWVLHEYRPDYGIDFALEVFSELPRASATRVYETMGEHLFIQLKTMESCPLKRVNLYSRMNVEKQEEILDKSQRWGQLDVLRISIEREELATIERMGVGVPVLLAVAELSRRQCYFVCLNDYIDKILIPRFSDYTNKASRTIQVPTLNRFDGTAVGQLALRWYAQRPKLYAAFPRFKFQFEELRRLRGSDQFFITAKYFAKRIGNYDFWETEGLWRILAHYGSALKRFLSTGVAGFLVDSDGQAIVRNQESRQAAEQELEVLKLWELLSRLATGYEDVCREWLLPTGLGYLSSYSPETHRGTLFDNLGRVAWPNVP